MINKLYYELLFNILEFLPNHEIMDFLCINKEINNMFKVKDIIEFMSYRSHPIVFNKIDNYCMICNQGLIFLSDNKSIIICNHY